MCQRKKAFVHYKWDFGTVNPSYGITTVIRTKSGTTVVLGIK